MVSHHCKVRVCSNHCNFTHAILYLTIRFFTPPYLRRLRGQSNLKLQHLPHFGDDSRDEIEDFVKHYDREHDDIQNSVKTHRSLHRRRISGALDLQNILA